MAFGGLIQTTLGRNLSTRSKLGTPMTFTHVAIGDGHYGGSYNDITHLTNPLFTLPATVTMVGDNALLEVDLNNSGITTGCYFREIGVYASDGTNSVLYAYDNAGNDAQLIQSGGGAISIAKRIRLVLTELADANIVIDNVDALYVTFEELAALDQSKADKSTAITTIITAAGWTGTAPPYAQTLTIVGVTPTNIVEVLRPLKPTEMINEVWDAAGFADGGQAGDMITALAWGDKPNVDLPCRVIIRRDL